MICTDNLNSINEIKVEFNQRFKTRDLGVVKSFLGLEINYNRDEGVLDIGQQNLIKRIIERLNLVDSKNVYSSMEKMLNLNNNSNSNNGSKTKKLYRQLLGCLKYLMLGSRPNLCFPISYFSQFQENAIDEHYNYLLTSNIKLRYKREMLKADNKIFLNFFLMQIGLIAN